MKLQCSGGDGSCTNFMEVPECAVPTTRYICREHTPKITEGPRFQNHAFDRELDNSKNPGVSRSLNSTTYGRRQGNQELKQFVDGSSWGAAFNKVGSGFQIKKFRTGYEKEVPEWARMKEGIQKILLTAFPKLVTNQNQRRRAGRWAQVINLYYIKGWSITEVAEELNEDPRAIKTLTRSIIRTSKGFRANGSGPRSR